MIAASVVRRRAATPLLVATLSIGLVFSATPAVTGDAVAAPVEPAPAGPVNPNAGWVEPTDEGLVRPDFTSASVTARSSGQRVEVLTERSRYQRSWVNPDGTVAAEQTGLVRFEDASAEGGWRDVNITLERQADGSARPVAVPDELVLGGAGDDQVVKLTDERGRVLSVGTGLAGVKLPEPALDGAVATYREVLPGVDLRVEARPAGFEQLWVVKSRLGVASLTAGQLLGSTLGFASKITSDKLAWTPKSDGSITVTDPASKDPVGTFAAPVMWDGTVDRGAADPRSVGKVDFQLRSGGVRVPVGEAVSSALELRVLPDAGWLTSSARVFPIVIDPTYVAADDAPISDTWVQSTSSEDKLGDPELKLGVNIYGDVARSYLNVRQAPFVGKKIKSASLQLYANYSGTCTPKGWSAWNAGTISGSTRWSSQPWVGSKYATSTQTKGNSAPCPSGTVSIDMKDQLQLWADESSTTRGLLLRADSETDPEGWKRFRSLNAASNPPLLKWTYNRAPGTPSLPYPDPRTWYDADGAGSGGEVMYTADTTPTLKASTGNDLDKNNVRNEYSVFANSTDTTTPIASCNTGYVTPGAFATCTLPVLTANSSVWMRARTFDGSERSRWVTPREMRVASSKPAAPAVSCTAPYSNNSWAATAPAADVACTITATGSGFSAPSRIRYSVDNGPWVDKQITQSTSGSVAKVDVTVKKTSGGHSVRAYAATPPGTLSGLAAHNFGYGATPSMGTPAASPRVTTAGRLPIATEGQPKGGATTLTGKVRWRVSGGTATSWADATAAAAPLTVTQVNGKSVVSGAFAVESLAGQPDSAGTVVNDRIPTLVDVQVCLSYDTLVQCTPAATVLRVPHAQGSGFPEAAAGPGQAALWTGELTVSDTDAEVSAPGGALSVSRSHSSFGGVGSTQGGVFGAGWTASFDDGGGGFGGSQIFDSTLVDGAIAVVDADGGALVFTSLTGDRRTGSALTTGAYLPADEDTDLSGVTMTMSGSGAATVLELKDEDGVVTKFAVTSAPTGTAPATFKTVEVRDAATAGKTTYAYDAAGRVTAVVAALPDGVTTCVPGTATNGCRVLKISYATATTATGSSPGDWVNQVKEIKAQVNAGPDKTLASYKYDSTGRLVEARDVRTNLASAYTWTGFGTGLRLATLTPPGEETYTFTYSGDKIATVTRPNPASAGGGTAQLAGYVYGLPTSGAGLPDVRYDPADTNIGVGRWGQGSAPTWGAAVFGPDKPITGNTPAAITNTADWAYADLQYTDAEGYTVNTAGYGAGAWQLTATDYDSHGNTIHAWDERALTQLAANPSANALELTTVTVYNDDISSGGTVVTPAGTLVTDTYGPVHDVVSAAGDLRPLRIHTATSYDQGAPNAGINPATGQPYRLPTTTVTTAETAGGDVDSTVSIGFTGYAALNAGDTTGWELGQATSSTIDMDLDGTVNAGDITTKTRYDSQGRTIENRQPKSTGTDAGTRVTTYYTASATGAAGCVSNPAYAGMVCQVGPAAQPSGQPMPVSKTTSYTWDGQTATSVDTSGAVTSTSTTSYDSATDRPLTSGTTVTGLSGSTPVPAVTTSYDPATGDVTGTNSTAGTTAMTYDSWGRQLTYTNTPTGQPADTATTTYNPLGQVSTVVDNNGQTSYTYDGTDAAGQTERRGQVTAVKVKVTGGIEYTSTGAYDEAGDLILERLPGNINRRTSIDVAGEQTDLAYFGQVTDPDTGVTSPDQPWLGWSTWSDPESQIAREWTPDTAAFTGDLAGTDAIGSDRNFRYDQANRLTRVEDRTGNPDTSGDVACTTRTYSFDNNGNRTGQNSHPAAADNTCTTTGGSPVTRAYDVADRPTSGATGAGSYTYDPLGRQTVIPAADAPKPADGNLTIGYFDSDAARTITQNGATTTFTLDGAGRRLNHTTTGSTANTLVRHYTDAGDNPTWSIDTTGPDSTSTRYNELINGDLGLTLSSIGGNTKAELDLSTPRDDIATTIVLSASMTAPDQTAATGIDTWTSYSEYGQPNQLVTSTPGGTTGVGYGWLGAKQRTTLPTSGLALMGARLYNRSTGLFTSMDPVYGGNNTAYGYPNDPVNSSDLDGNEAKWRKRLRIGAAIFGGIAAAACIVATAGICLGAALAAAAASGAYNAYKWRRKEISGRRAFYNTAYDSAGIFLRPLRYARVASRFRYVPRRATRYGRAVYRHANRSRYRFHRTSYRRAYYRHPYRYGFRAAYSGYGGYSSYRNFRNR